MRIHFVEIPVMVQKKELHVYLHLPMSLSYCGHQLMVSFYKDKHK